MARLETVTATAPAHWASYLVNGDDSGLEPEEKRQAAKFAAWLGAWPVDCSEAGFMWTHDAMRVCGALAAECESYTALVEVGE